VDKKTLLKIARLAIWGSTQGERDAAKRILDKNGVTATDLLKQEEEETPQCVSIAYKTVAEKTIILQNWFRLTNKNSVEYWKMSGRRMDILIAPSLADEFVRTSKALIRDWRQKLKKILEAFIQKNGLYSDSPITAESVTATLSESEILEILALSRALDRVYLGRELPE